LARSEFGGGAAEFLASADGTGSLILAPSVAVTFWDDETAGTQHTDLTDIAGAAIAATVITDEFGTIPRIKGPDAVTRMWVDTGGSAPRRRIVAVDATAPSAATETVAGVVELATTAEAAAGADTTRAVTPAGLATATSALAPKTALEEELGPFSVTGAISVQSGTNKVYVEHAYDLVSVRASVGTAPTGASLIVDVNRNGTTIFGTQANRPTITAGTTTDLAGAASVTSYSSGDYFTVDVDQVGSTVAGSNLTVQIRLRRTDA
jgi:hypothetical protein